MGYLSLHGRWSNPLVLNSQFFDDRSFPLGNGCHDYAAHSIPWHLQVQPIGDSRRSSRGDRVEISSRGCFQASNELRFALCLCWNRCSVFRNDTGHNDFRSTWIPIPFEPRRLNDSNASSLGIYGHFCRICFNSSLQNVQRNRMEENHSPNSLYVPRNPLCYFLCSERTNLGGGILRSCPIRDHVRISLLVVWNFCAPRFCR